MKKHVPFPARYRRLVATNPNSILLESSRFNEDNYRSYLFTEPLRILSAGEGLFDEIDKAIENGAYVAGYFAYECGEGLSEIGSIQQHNSNMPLAWFGVYSKPYIFNHRTGEFEGDAPGEPFSDSPTSEESFQIHNLRFGLSEKIYADKIAAIQEYIRAGDTYQVNFTDQVQFDFTGDSMAFFESLIKNQPVEYSAFLHGENWKILSFSPELFFHQTKRKIVTRPMKGTAPRGMDEVEDEKIAHSLQNDQKNQSENVMIVDLMRNDLGRICEFGSVRVDNLFAVEKYETLFQMSSQVSGMLRPEVRAREIFHSLFPCGSVTGAPKHRTLEIIEELERGSRGIYTGAIGFFSPSQESVFSVPIRTIILKDNCGVMGVGSGIVIDSQPEEEYRECLLKFEFLTRREQPFQLIETILWQEVYRFLPLHLDRLRASSTYFGFNFDQQSIVEALENVSRNFSRGERIRVRILLERSGAVEITHSEVKEQKASATIKISETRVSSHDRFLRHKTTRRQLYEQQYAEAQLEGFDEVLFLNERNEVTEGTISNLFIEKDGLWFTPPLACGVLPGIFRRHLLESKPGTEEKILHLEDLQTADAVYICNALRGLRKVIPAATRNS